MAHPISPAENVLVPTPRKPVVPGAQWTRRRRSRRTRSRGSRPTRPGDDAASDRVIGPESHDESEDAKAKEQHGRCEQISAKPAGLRLHRLKRNRVLQLEHRLDPPSRLLLRGVGRCHRDARLSAPLAQVLSLWRWAATWPEDDGQSALGKPREPPRQRHRVIERAIHR